MYCERWKSTYEQLNYAYIKMYGFDIETIVLDLFNITKYAMGEYKRNFLTFGGITVYFLPTWGANVMI